MTAPNDDLQVNEHILTSPIEDSKSSITTLAMYYYKSMMDAGYSQQDAKESVADLLEETYNHYCEIGNIPKKTLGTVDKKLEKVLDALKPIAKDQPALRNIYMELVSISSQLKKG